MNLCHISDYFKQDEVLGAYLHRVGLLWTANSRSGEEGWYVG